MNYHKISSFGLIFLQFLLLFNACIVAYALVLTKKLANLHPLVVEFNNGLVFTIVGGLLYHVNIVELFYEGSSSTFDMDFSVYIKGLLFSGSFLAIGNSV